MIKCRMSYISSCNVNSNGFLSKNIIDELNKRDKLNKDKYDIWHCKIQYILEEQKALEMLTNTMVELVHRPSETWMLTWPGSGRTI